MSAHSWWHGLLLRQRQRLFDLSCSVSFDSLAVLCPSYHPILQAPIAALHGSRLVCLAPAAPGGSRLDAARSIDLLAARDSVSFLARMRPEVASAAKELEAWVAHQQHGLDMAAGGGDMSTEKLLKVRGGGRGEGGAACTEACDAGWWRASMGGWECRRHLCASSACGCCLLHCFRSWMRCTSVRPGGVPPTCSLTSCARHAPHCRCETNVAAGLAGRGLPV